MAAIIRKFLVGYNYLFDEIADKRTKEWFLLGSPIYGIALLALYLMFVFKWGPKWMKNRKPFNLDRIMILYNFFQIVACGYLVVNASDIWIRKYKYICQPVDYSDSPDALNMAKLTYVYFSLKMIDLLDTIFFVLRKKDNHITFLHVYHHTGMVMLAWGVCMYYAGGHGTMVGIVNAFVHVIMYSYYLLTVICPSLKNSLWWKKYVTQLQIIQFLHNVVFMGSIVFVPGCGYPRWTAGLFLPQNTFMLTLFIDFYIKAYVKKPKQISKNIIEEKQKLNEANAKVKGGEVEELLKLHNIGNRSALNEKTQL